MVQCIYLLVLLVDGLGDDIGPLRLTSHGENMILSPRLQLRGIVGIKRRGRGINWALMRHLGRPSDGLCSPTADFIRALPGYIKVLLATWGKHHTQCISLGNNNDISSQDAMLGCYLRPPALVGRVAYYLMRPLSLLFWAGHLYQVTGYQC